MINYMCKVIQSVTEPVANV